jgi:deoxyribose-phosphate aldolase
MNDFSINRYLDHAVLKPEMAQKEAEDAIRLGIRYKVKTVCVRPCDIDLALRLCNGTETGVSCTLGFPHGVVPSEIKVEEAKLYAAKGIKEIDMVANFGYIKSGLWDLVERDVRLVSEVTREKGIVLKVILETALLTEEEIIKATEACISANADFVKTSTGFNGGGADVEAVKTMLKAAGGRIAVKAAGGIRDYSRAKLFIDMGCSRLGNNYAATPAICDGQRSTEVGNNPEQSALKGEKDAY